VRFNRQRLALIAALGVTQIISWGSLYYAIGILGPIMVAQGHLSTGVVYGGYSLSLLISGLSAPITGRAIDRLGGGRVMALGSVLAAAALALMAASRGAPLFIAASVVAGVAISMTLYEAAFASLVGLTRRRTADAIAALTLIGGFASTVFWPLTEALQRIFDWRETYYVYALVHLLVCLPLHILLLRPVEDEAAEESEKRVAHIDDTPPDLSTERRRLVLALIVIVFFTNNFAISGLTVHFVPLLVALGLSSAAAVAVGVLFGPGQVAGRIVAMTAGRNLSAVSTGLWSTAIFPVSFLFLLAGPQFWAAAAFGILVGSANGVLTIARGTIPLALFGRTGYGALMGSIALPTVVARASAPLAFAKVMEFAGTLSGFFVAVAAGVMGLAGMAVLAVLARRRPSPEHKLPPAS
jgi:predicted MFS family arabinose efflux permease